MVCIKKQPYIYYVRLTFKNRHFFRYLTCLLDRGHIILGALFFAFTFIFNRSMNLSGGSWVWSASLRYLFSLPMLAVLAWRKGELAGVLSAIKKEPLTWLVWSTVGFGLFYGPLSLASIYGESWFVAATWQITILAGLLLTPLFGQRVPGKQLLMTLVILLGIILIQIPYFGSGLGSGVVRASLLILLAAFAYPLGNRKMMEIGRAHV